jgi:hypothetical protein
MFQIVLAILIYFTCGISAYGLEPGFYKCGKKWATNVYSHPEDSEGCDELALILKNADQKVWCDGRSVRATPPASSGWVVLDSAKPAIGKGKLVVIWFQTDCGSALVTYSPVCIRRLMRKIHKIEHRIYALGYSRVVMITPSLSNTTSGFYVLKDAHQN